MTRGVRSEGWTVNVYRSRTYRRLRGVEEYKLEFVYHEGSPHIEVRFRGHIQHDVINVYDYEKGAPRITTKTEVKAEVNEYMAALNAEALRTYWDNRPLGAA
jgi:hypothetical protein